MRAAFYTLGCKVNQYETQVLTEQFSAYGYDIVNHMDMADIYVINSCTVTAMGDKKTRQAIRRFKRMNPGAVVVLMGCFPQAFPEQAEELPEADIITGAGDKQAVLELVNRFLIDGVRIVKILPHIKEESFEPMKTEMFVERTRAFVKIQDGCEHFCSYCIIPYARGFCRSKALEDLKTELYDLQKKGFQEVVLVGIDLSSYGKDHGTHLVDAVTLACTTQGICRVRLGSLEPLLLTDQNLKVLSELEDKGLCPQFHLSLQSGCDATLKRMNRHYDTAFYRELVAKLRENFRNSTITTDIMVGFPGETEEEFLQSAAFVQEIAFAKAHVFAYSVRKGTRAANFPQQVSPQDKEARSHKMTKIVEQSRKAFLKSQVGLLEDVLFENDIVDGCYTGCTKNYTPVRVKANMGNAQEELPDLRRQLHNVYIQTAEKDFCMGQLSVKI